MGQIVHAVGVVYLLTAATVSGIDVYAMQFVATDPARYQALAAWGRGSAIPVAFLLGFATFSGTFADLARCADLDSKRARFRTGAIATLLASALALSLDPMDPSLSLDEVVALASGIPWWRFAQFALLAAFAVCHFGASRSPVPETPRDVNGAYASPFVPPLFGSTPMLPERQWRVLGLMVIVGMFAAYDFQVVSLALKQIQADLGIAEGQVGWLGFALRAGAIPGVVFALLADSLGRKKILLVAILGYTLATGATAFAPNTETFVACQIVARSFGAAEAVIAGVVIAEEFDAAHRGWAIGVLAGLSTLGNALAWVLFGMIDAVPLGWRGLFLVGLGPLAVVALLRRNLPETQRFEARVGAARPSLRAIFAPLGALFQMYPQRLLAAGAAGFLVAFSGSLAGFLFPKFLQDTHGVGPSQLTYAVIAAGTIGLCAGPLLGRLGDRIGRRRVVTGFLIVNPLTVMWLYNAPVFGIAILGFLLMMVTDAGSDLNLSAYKKEMFPTSHRATAGGAFTIIGLTGASLGLAAESILYGWTGSHAEAVSWIAATGLLAPLIVWKWFPETAGRPLEETAPEVER